MCKKLDLDLEKEQPLLKGTTAPDENLSNRLMAIENDIDLVSPDLALEELREIHLEKNDPLLSEYFFLKAKCYSKKSLLKKAHSYYLKSIQQADITKNETNLRAAAYYEIGRIMHSNSIKEALHYVEKGLDSYVENQYRRYIKHYLKVSKAIYLEMDNKVGESLQILEELWSEQNNIPSTEALLNMYDLQAKFFFKMQLYDKAISITKEGIERARIDKMYDRSYELWTTLGGCYIEKNQLAEAQRCFRTALNLEKYIRRDYLLVTSQTQLGLLYLKQKNVVKAKELLEEAVKLGRKCNDVHRLNEALVGLGDCYLAEPNYKKARQCFEEALSLTKKQSDFDKKEDSILIKLLICTDKDSKDYQDYEKRFIQIHMNKLNLHLPQGGEVNMRPDSQTNSIKINSADPPDA